MARNNVTKIASKRAVWRERKANGAPIPTLYNTRVMINVIGVECRYDVFHDRILLDYDGEHYEVRQLVGVVDDSVLVRLRQLLSSQFGFDPTAVHVYDAVRTIAFENCFDPVLDLLEEAQGKWDGTMRLDTWVVTYLGCEDTPLNRAIGRKVLIAAVHRARVPGCKFDTITVLEGPEGINKSTAIRILAGDDNFSDQSILAARDKEVQEQLCGVWMHENADLAGMRRADVEHVKAFASRQTDIARPAYGRVVEKKPRRSIEWGTTNSDEYLQSQTGNRRIWPLKTTVIDIEALKRDRLQLLGEAAAAEAAGESIVLDSELWEAAAIEQEKRRIIHPWEYKLANIPYSKEIDRGENCESKTITIIHVEGNVEKVSSADLLTYVLGVPIDRQGSEHSRQLATAMTNAKAGWKRSDNKITIGGRRVRGYFRDVGVF